MDRNLAAINPSAADAWAKDKVAESMLKGRPRVEAIEDPMEGTRAYRAMNGLGEELRAEVAADTIRNAERGRKVWDSF